MVYKEGPSKRKQDWHREQLGGNGPLAWALVSTQWLCMVSYIFSHRSCHLKRKGAEGKMLLLSMFSACFSPLA